MSFSCSFCENLISELSKTDETNRKDRDFDVCDKCNSIFCRQCREQDLSLITIEDENGNIFNFCVCCTKKD